MNALARAILEEANDGTKVMSEEEWDKIPSSERYEYLRQGWKIRKATRPKPPGKKPSREMAVAR